MVLMSQHEQETGLSYWHVLRIIFVIFFLFLTGEVFFRWDAFSFYSTLEEFLPAVALITIFWSIITVFSALLSTCFA